VLRCLAAADRGHVRRASLFAIREGLVRELAQSGVDLDAITDQLEDQGVEAFRDSYREVLRRIEQKSAELESRAVEQPTV
jgi:hypothetical protein